MARGEITTNIKRLVMLPVFTGLVMGVVAAAAQAFMHVQPPAAYGICFLGHPRDLVNWAVDHLFNTHWPVINLFSDYPTFLVLGVLLGSLTAAYRNNELIFRSGPIRKKTLAFVIGFLVVNFGLLWGSCPIRTTLLVAYGNLMAVVAILSIAFGVVVACIFIRWLARRSL